MGVPGCFSSMYLALLSSSPISSRRDLMWTSVNDHHRRGAAPGWAISHPTFFIRNRWFLVLHGQPTAAPGNFGIQGIEVKFPVTAFTRWDEKAGLHGMRYAPRIDVLYAQEKETGDEED